MNPNLFKDDFLHFTAMNEIASKKSTKLKLLKFWAPTRAKLGAAYIFVQKHG